MTRRPMLVHVSQLRHAPNGRKHERRVAQLDGLRVTGSAVPVGGEVDVDLELIKVESAIEARGRVRAPWIGDCVRCLKPVKGEVDVEVREVFTTKAVEGDSYPIEGDQIDLEPLARETVVLELPQVPLCKEDCLGLCPVCGVDRNESPCTCDTTPRDPRWAALDRLRTDEA